MKIESERFGVIEVDEADPIRFPAGIIGFPAEREFILIRHGASGVIAWMQSLQSPALALPVVSAHAFGPEYPDVPLGNWAEQAGLGAVAEDLSVLVVLCALEGQPATVNLLAPIVVNVTTHVGAQVILDGSRFSTRELFQIPSVSDAEATPAAPEGEVAGARADAGSAQRAVAE